ncbi:hypothetical protein BDW74DRAFT_172312 [Aspergillus multicolor]|uniref:uncharacterized protein n=1 Tax=Aspergillus multicolor TaxID=41759 RepID=UPI003CCD9E15
MFDKDGLLTGVLTDPTHDDTPFHTYFPLSMCTSLAGCRVVNYSQLKELDRIGTNNSCINVLSYKDENGVTQTVAVKFNILVKDRRLNMEWNEMHILKNLPPHPNILPLDRLVLDDGDVQDGVVQSRLLGFTTKFVEGGSLDHLNPKTPFRLEWLRQLINVVNFLNLELGIMHQDLAAQNILVEHEANKVILSDFGRGVVGVNYLRDHCDDIAGVVHTLYKVITNDDSVAPTGRTLDADVSKFRAVLSNWIAKRTACGEEAGLKRYLDASKRSGIKPPPPRPSPPDDEIPYQCPDRKTADLGYRARYTYEAIRNGQYVFKWQRPGQNCMMNGSRKRARVNSLVAD